MKAFLYIRYSCNVEPVELLLTIQPFCSSPFTMLTLNKYCIFTIEGFYAQLNPNETNPASLLILLLLANIVDDDSWGKPSKQ